MLWLLLEIVDIITDFIALSRILETPTLSSFFDAYITLVSLATVLSVYLVYDRSVVLYAVRYSSKRLNRFFPFNSLTIFLLFGFPQVLKQRFSGTLKMKVIDGIMNGEASSEYSKKQMKLQLLLAKRRGLIITIALAICEVITAVYFENFRASFDFAFAGHSVCYHQFVDYRQWIFQRVHL